MITLLVFLISSVICIANPLVEDFLGREKELNEEEIRNIDNISFIKDSQKTKADWIRQLSDDHLTIILEKKEGSHHNELLPHFHVIEWTLRVELKDEKRKMTLFKVFISGASPLDFYAYINYDKQTKELTLYTLRHENDRCVPIVYVWKDLQLKSKVKYSAGLLPEDFADSLVYIKRQNCDFYLLKMDKKPEDSLEFETKINIYKHHLEQPKIQMNKVFDILGVIFPYIPEEFFISKLHPIRASKYQLKWIKSLMIGNKNEDIMSKMSECIEDNSFANYYGYYGLSDSAVLYHLVLSELERRMIDDAQLEEPTEEQLSQFVTELKAEVSGYPALSKEIDNAITQRLPKEDLRRYYRINEFFKKKYETFTDEAKQAPAKQNVTVEDFYNTHKNWAFVKIEPPFDKHYNLNGIGKNAFKTFIASEILRLQQIGLQDFIEGKIPVKLEFNVKAKPRAANLQPPGIP